MRSKTHLVADDNVMPAPSCSQRARMTLEIKVKVVGIDDIRVYNQAWFWIRTLLGPIGVRHVLEESSMVALADHDDRDLRLVGCVMRRCILSAAITNSSGLLLSLPFRTGSRLTPSL